MTFRVAFEEGPTLEESFFVGVEEKDDGTKEEEVVRASHVLHPAMVKAIEQIKAKAGTVAEKEQELDALSVQPQKYVEYFQAACHNLQAFRETCMNFALQHKAGLPVEAEAKMDKMPTTATEPQPKPKVGEEPMIATEEQKSDGPAMESAPAYRQYIGKMPNKAVGRPEIALDYNSSEDPRLQALAEELEKTKGELADTKGKLKEKESKEELGEIMQLLTEIGAVEDAKDREGFEKDFAGAEEKAVGLVEKVLRKIRDAVAGKKKPAGMPPAGGPPKLPAPPKPPALAPKGMGGMPAMSSQANLLQASLHEEVPPVRPVGNDAIRVLQTIWMRDDQRKQVSAV
jgi:hypothetical protein